MQMWRDTLGQTVSPSFAADGDGDGQVTSADLAVWQANYGASVPALAAATPEPSTAAVTAVGGLLVAFRSAR